MKSSCKGKKYLIFHDKSYLCRALVLGLYTSSKTAPIYWCLPIHMVKPIPQNIHYFLHLHTGLKTYFYASHFLILKNKKLNMESLEDFEP